jgi:hypothetical protein
MTRMERARAARMRVRAVRGRSLEAMDVFRPPLKLGVFVDAILTALSWPDGGPVLAE